MGFIVNQEVNGVVGFFVLAFQNQRSHTGNSLPESGGPSFPSDPHHCYCICGNRGLVGWCEKFVTANNCLGWFTWTANNLWGMDVPATFSKQVIIFQDLLEHIREIQFPCIYAMWRITETMWLSPDFSAPSEKRSEKEEYTRIVKLSRFEFQW